MPNKKQFTFFLVAFAFALTVFSLWLVAFWPGLFNYDTFSNVEDLHNGIYRDWSSYLYYIYLYALGLPSNSFAIVGCFQVFFASLGAAVLFLIFWKWGSPLWLCALCFFAFVLSPLNGAFNIYYVYDWFFSWIYLFVVIATVAAIRRYRREGKVLVGSLVFVAIAIPFVIRWRNDSALLLIVVPVILALTLRLTLRVWGTLVVAFLLSGVLFYFLLPSILNVSPRGPKYALTAVLNPLSYVLHQTLHQFDTSERAEQERQIIDKVIDYKRLIEERSDYEIPAFHNGATRDSFTSDQVADFYRTCFKIFWRHPGIFFANRFQMFFAISGFTSTVYTADELVDGNYDHARETRSKYGLSAESKLPELRKVLRPILHLMYIKGYPLATYLDSLFVCFVACGFALVMYKFTPLSAIAVVLMCCRLPIVFLFAPANLFKYVYGLYLFGFFLIPLMGSELAKARKTGP